MEEIQNAENQSDATQTAAPADVTPTAGTTAHVPATGPEAAAAPQTAVPSRRRPSFPSWYDYLVLALLFCGSQLVLGYVALRCGYTSELAQHLAARPVAGHIHSDATMNVAARATALGYVAGMASLVFMTLVYRRLRGAHGRVARFSPRGFDPALLLQGFIVLLAATVVAEPLVELLPGTPDYNMLGRGSWTLLSTVVCAPLFEEFLFRGVILEAARRRRGVIAAWLISSLCFGLAHGLPSQMVGAGIIGLVLGFVYIRSGSLFSGIVLHALNNALAMLLLILGFGDATLASLVGERTYYAIYAVSAVIFLWWAVSACRTMWKTEKSESANRN